MPLRTVNYVFSYLTNQVQPLDLEQPLLHTQILSMVTGCQFGALSHTHHKLTFDLPNATHAASVQPLNLLPQLFACETDENLRSVESTVRKSS